MEPDGTILVLGICLFVLLSLTVVMRYLQLPSEHVESRRRRDELRRMMVKQKVVPQEFTRLEIAIEEMNSRNK